MVVISAMEGKGGLLLAAALIGGGFSTLLLES